MSCESYEVGVRDLRGKMLTRTWSKDEVLTAIPWLKRQNALGADVYVRPGGDQPRGIVLLDDLSRGALEKMITDGYTPAAIVETSPTNFQAWVRVANHSLLRAVSTEICRQLAEDYGGDLRSADWRHFGRLAGFTNRKPEHSDKLGRFPYVLSHESTGALCPMGPDLLGRAEYAVAMSESKTRMDALKAFKPIGGFMNDPDHEYQRQAADLIERYGSSIDYSKMDWMIAVSMSKTGRFDQADIRRAIARNSPEVLVRKAGHVHDYAQRTADKAWTSDEVQAHRQEEARRAAQKSSRGFRR